MAKIPHSSRYSSAKSTRSAGASGNARSSRNGGASAPESSSSILLGLVALGVFGFLVVKFPLVALGLGVLALIGAFMPGKH